METLGETIRRFRIEAGLSKKELADKTYTSPSVVAKWEEDYLVPSSKEIKMLRGIFGLSEEDELLPLTPEQVIQRDEESGKRLQEIVKGISRFSSEVQENRRVQLLGQDEELDIELKRLHRNRVIIILVLAIIAIIILVLFYVDGYYNSFEYIEGR
ncbi:MAG: helix-turn-helix transcriptional regulator [Clostridiales bacterium]|nr:helix-turn-helix transcriptional regulator [Clostridiales bacterium]